MQMTEGEIRRMYKAARNKKKQVSILADLNRCSTGVILEVIHGKREPEKEEPELPQVPAEIDILIRRLEELESMIKPLEEEYRKTAAELIRIGERDAARD